MESETVVDASDWPYGGPQMSMTVSDADLSAMRLQLGGEEVLRRYAEQNVPASLLKDHKDIVVLGIDVADFAEYCRRRGWTAERGAEDCFSCCVTDDEGRTFVALLVAPSPEQVYHFLTLFRSCGKEGSGVFHEGSSQKFVERVWRGMDWARLDRWKGTNVAVVIVGSSFDKSKEELATHGYKEGDTEGASIFLNPHHEVLMLESNIQDQPLVMLWKAQYSLWGETTYWMARMAAQSLQTKAGITVQRMLHSTKVADLFVNDDTLEDYVPWFLKQTPPTEDEILSVIEVRAPWCGFFEECMSSVRRKDVEELNNSTLVGGLEFHHALCCLFAAANMHGNFWLPFVVIFIVCKRRRQLKWLLRIIAQLESVWGDVPGPLLVKLWNKKGVILALDYQCEEAIHTFKSALDSCTIASFSGDEKDQMEADIQHGLGCAFVGHGKWSLALEPLEKALALFEKLGDKYSMSQVHGHLGLLAGEQKHFDAAVEHYNKSIGLSQDAQTRGRIFHGLGVVEHARRRYDQAEKHLLEALACKRSVKDRSEEASTLNLLGEVSRELGKWEAAEAFHREALEVYHAFKVARFDSITYFRLGVIASHFKRWSHAEECFKKALEQSTKDWSMSSEASINLGLVALEQGLPNVAAEHFRTAIVQFRKQSHPSMLFKAFWQLGNLYANAREWEKSAEFFFKATMRAVDQKLPVDIANSASQHGVVLMELRQWQKAEDSFQLALKTFRELKDMKNIARALHFLGKAAAAMRNYAKGEACQRQALAVCEGDDVIRAPVLLYLGMAVKAQHRRKEAESFYQQALLVSLKGDMKVASSCYHQLGLLAQDDKHWAAAQELFSKSLSIKEQVGDTWGCAKTLHALGEVALGQNRFQEAQLRFEESLALFLTCKDEREAGLEIFSLGDVAKMHADHFQTLGRLDEERQQRTVAAKHYTDARAIFTKYKDTERLALLRSRESSPRSIFPYVMAGLAMVAVGAWLWRMRRIPE